MNYLVDTHLALWSLGCRERLPLRAQEILSDHNNTLTNSLVSAWEVTLKHAKRPDAIAVSGQAYMSYCNEAGYVQLPITSEHIRALETLERAEGAPPHNDPFDRMLLAQAKAEGMMLLTHDKAFAGYNEPNVFIV